MHKEKTESLLRKIARWDEGEKLSINAIALKADLPQSTLDSRYKKGQLTADQVLAIAKAYGYNPVRALMEAGFLEESDFWTPSIKVALQDATDAEIVEEVARRIALGSTEDFDKPIDGV